jgi:hypothetical protein
LNLREGLKPSPTPEIGFFVDTVLKVKRVL